MAEPEKKQADDEVANQQPQAPLMYFEGPWTEADEIFVECLTGEYDERLRREAREADL